MPDILYIASTGVAAAQTAINVTGQNIANVSSAGYVREKVSQTSAIVGQGTQVVAISRIYDQFLASQASAAITTSSYSSVQYGQIQSLNSILTDPNAGVSPALSNFFNSLQTVANNPADIAPRESALGAAKNLVSSVNYLQKTIDNTNVDVNTQLTQSVTRINDYANQIVTLNKAILGTKDQSSLNTLKDQRDAVITDLSKEIKVSVNQQGDQYLVSVGSGIPLLDSTRSFPMKVSSNPFNPVQIDVVISGTENSVFTSKNSPGGLIGGLVEFRDNILNPASNKIGLVALGLATEINVAQSKGRVDNGTATGAVGDRLFSVGNILVSANDFNAGATNLSVSFDTGTVGAPISPEINLKNIKSDDYTLKVIGGSTGYSVTNNTTGQSQTFNSTELVLDGFKISITGALTTGDSFRISPTANVARNLSLVTSDPRAIAAADNSSPFLSGDNRNMANLLAAQTNKNLNGGVNSLSSSFNQFISSIGSQSYQLKVQSTFDQTVMNKTSQALDNYSGVNLDEEASNLIRYQQAYQASGKVMQIAKQMFDSLLNMAQ
jgi:flagellar hook-associated protein 1 FlgK